MAAPKYLEFALRPRRRMVIALTPLIDVVFILLVFFMLVSTFLDWRSIEMTTDAAALDSTGSSGDAPLLITVSSAQIRLDGRVVLEDDLAGEVQALLADNPAAIVSVRPLEDVPLQSLISVLDLLQGAGIERFRLSEDIDWEKPSIDPSSH
ncbi:ExbD/TolR family protein [Thioalkalivibrio sp. HK1]|uniref:ExbD/TolR family protein n=1 Tax=Thioalkalivibrio sp. HK1 TaxID=1469245 RepID=UPI000471769B|nr:biopolymer transporter ExbD [Thioalkalivibrio sp. HK1]